MNEISKNIINGLREPTWKTEPIENQPTLEVVFRTCETCKWWISQIYPEHKFCSNPDVRSFMAAPTVFEPPANFGCNFWEAR